MNKMNPAVDVYFKAGCGRCPLGNTPKCKVNTWQEELKALRTIVLASGLTEELKWGVPCYTMQNKNIVVIGAFNEYCAISFFKGALLSDAKGILCKPGENTQAGRLVRFTNVREIVAMEATLKAYLHEAIEVEKAGLKVAFKEATEFAVPEEFQNKLDTNPGLKAAFYALTPGRQRGYLLYFAAAKQSKTREARIEKCLQNILDGIGLNEQ